MKLKSKLAKITDVSWWLKRDKKQAKNDWLSLEPKMPRSIESNSTGFQPSKVEGKINFKPSFKPIKVWHIQGFRTAKRVLATILFLFDILFFIGSIGANMVWFQFFFFFTSFILLDYLWKSKKVKIEIES